MIIKKERKKERKKETKKDGRTDGVDRRTNRPDRWTDWPNGQSVAARIFGWFSKVELNRLYPAIITYSLWSMLVMVVKIAMAERKVLP